MPSSIFSSENQLNNPSCWDGSCTTILTAVQKSSERKRSSKRGTIASAAFVCLAVLCYCYIEYRARRLDSANAVLESREDSEEEYRTILEAGKRPADSARMLVLGNSLLLRGVQFEKVQNALSPDFDAKRLVVVNTSYFDWYYTMQQLFREGAKADVVVLVMNPKQFAAWNVREDYFAHHLMNLRDIFSIAWNMKLSNTEASNLVFANLSQYYDLRAKIRNKQIRKIFTNLGPLMRLITHEPPPTVKPIPESLAVERLRAMRDLAARWNAKFILVLPPSDGGKGDINAAILLAAGKAAGVPVLAPVEAGSLGADYYLDGFHLNTRGAETFTPQFVASLQKETAVYLAKKESRTASVR